MTYYDEPLLDREILNENTMSSEALQAELFTLFFEQGVLYIKQLQDALHDGDSNAWRMTAHGVKGASRSLGMTRLASVALEAEKSTPDAANLAAIISTIEETRSTIWPQENAA